MIWFSEFNASLKVEPTRDLLVEQFTAGLLCARDRGTPGRAVDGVARVAPPDFRAAGAYRAKPDPGPETRIAPELVAEVSVRRVDPPAAFTVVVVDVEGVVLHGPLRYAQGSDHFGVVLRLGKSDAGPNRVLIVDAKYRIGADHCVCVARPAPVRHRTAHRRVRAEIVAVASHGAEVRRRETGTR